MQTRLKNAISALKDQTSIGLARVGVYESSALEEAILKATTHNDEPIEDRHVVEVLQFVSSDRRLAGCCARAIGRRVGRTRSWAVVVKSLLLVLRVFQDGGPNFPGEVLQAMRKGYKILNISRFRDKSTVGCHWDFTVFVRTFAVFLDQWLVCFLMGKLQRRKQPNFKLVKPFILLDRLSHWQSLLDGAIETQPTGPSRTNRLVQSCLYAIVQETFVLYGYISDGLDFLQHNLFHLKRKDCLNVYRAYVKASKQFKELSSFYEFCKGIGVGRNFEYPTIRHVSQELVDTIKDSVFKNQSSGISCPGINMDLAVGDSLSVNGPESECGVSLEDLMSVDPRFSPERYSDPGHVEEFESDPFGGIDLLENTASKPEEQEQRITTECEDKEPALSIGECWEIALFETTTSQESSNVHHNLHEVATNDFGFELDFCKSNNSESNANIRSPWVPFEDYYNPFLRDTVESSFSKARIVPPANNSQCGPRLCGEWDATSAIVPFDPNPNPNPFYSGPTFQVSPTFRATGVEMPRNDLISNTHDNPFGSFSSQDQRMSLAMVTFGQISNIDNQFSQYPTFQETPTFRATGLEIDLGNRYDDWFGSFSSGSSLATVPTFQATPTFPEMNQGGLHDPFGSTFRTGPTFRATVTDKYQNGSILEQSDSSELLHFSNKSFLGSVSKEAPGDPFSSLPSGT